MLTYGAAGGVEEGASQLDEALQVVARASAKAAQSFQEENALSQS